MGKLIHSSEPDFVEPLILYEYFCVWTAAYLMLRIWLIYSNIWQFLPQWLLSFSFPDILLVSEIQTATQ